MIAFRGVLIANQVTRVSRNLRVNFEDHAGRKISCVVFACEPVCRKGDVLIDRLLESELTAATICVWGDHVSAKEIPAESNSGASREGLLRHCIGISAQIVGAVAHWNEQVVAKHNGQPLSAPS